MRTSDVGRVVAVVQARKTSTRLPDKVLLPLVGRPMLSHVLERVSAVPGVDAVALAIPHGPDHDPLSDIAATIGGISVVRGPEDDVLSRTLLAAEETGADTVLRVTSDCPMLDPAVSAAVLSSYQQVPVSYARTAIFNGFPRGLDTEVIGVSALRAAHEEASDPYEREHVTPFVWRRPERFPALQLGYVPDRSQWRLTVDAPEDYELATEIFAELHRSGELFGLAAIERLFERRPSLPLLNAGAERTAYVGVPPDLSMTPDE